MKKKMIGILIASISLAATALTPDERMQVEKDNLKLLEELGLPLPGSGIKIVPRAMLGMDSAQIEAGNRARAEFNEKGYVEKFINYPAQLLSISPEKVKKELKSVRYPVSKEYSGLSENISKLKLAFDFPSLKNNRNLMNSESSSITILAATPKGAFHEELGGWSGAVEFFIHEKIGTCSYSVMNVKAANTAVRLAQEDVTYTINDKATVLLPVEGSENSGFIYSLEWYDDKNFHELECANMKYSSEINESVIELAKNIDIQ